MVQADSGLTSSIKENTIKLCNLKDGRWGIRLKQTKRQGRIVLTNHLQFELEAPHWSGGDLTLIVTWTVIVVIYSAEMEKLGLLLNQGLSHI